MLVVPICELFPVAEDGLVSDLVNSACIVLAPARDEQPLVDEMVGQNKRSPRKLALRCAAAHDRHLVFFLFHVGNGGKEL